MLRRRRNLTHSRFSPRTRGRVRGVRAAALLEVVLSLSILLVAMAVIGMTFREGQNFVERAELRTRAMLMTEKIITDFDTNVMDIDEREDHGWFVIDGVTESPEGMSWKVEVEPSTRVEGLLNIDIAIYIGDPDDEETRQNVLRTRIVRAEPRGLDFERDFGLDEDQIEQITSLIPGGAQLLDPTNFDPRTLANLPLDQLIELLPTIMSAFGGQFGGAQIDQLLQMVESGDVSGLQNAANQAGVNVNPTGSNEASDDGGGQTPLTPAIPRQPGRGGR